MFFFRKNGFCRRSFAHFPTFRIQGWTDSVSESEAKWRPSRKSPGDPVVGSVLGVRSRVFPVNLRLCDIYIYIIWYILLYSCYIIYDILIIDKQSNKHAYTNHISSIYHTKLTSAEMNTKQKECLSNYGASAPFEFEVLKEILDS